MNTLSRTIQIELKAHAPFTAFGALSGIIILLITISTSLSQSFTASIFWSLHPAHVFLSSLVTAGMFRIHGKESIWTVLIIGYVGSVGIATLSDSIIPYFGEWILDFPNKSVHLGFLEKWWLVNPLAILGASLAFIWPKTMIPHTGHVLLSTWASLFHMLMALERGIGLLDVGLIFIFLFFAVWLPCCTSDIVFPLLFTERRGKNRPFPINSSISHQRKEQ